MPSSWPRWVSQVLLVRLRFPLILLGVVALIGGWPWLRNHWDRLLHPGDGIDQSISIDTEYWCPMCPGVLSDWPGKCPVCYMALVRRQKGEAAPLPDGVVARMQFSPYRVQLAGIRTTPVEYRPLAWETTLGGIVEAGEAPGRAIVPVEIPETEIGYLRPGQIVEIASDAFPGQSWPGQMRELGKELSTPARTLRVRVEVEDSRRELRSGMFVTARWRVPVTELEIAGRFTLDAWRDRTTGEVALRSIPLFAAPAPGLESLLETSGRMALHRRQLALAIPTSAVIDTGERKVVFVERMPGMFDGVEVTLGRRCGDYYPVLRGLDPGQAVVTAGAFLLDAETRLNPSLAAGYFGAAGRSSRTGASSSGEGSDKPSPEDQQLIAKQKLCPVTDEPLGSMGAPVRVVIDGKPVFICCKGCEAELRGHPQQYLAKLRSK